MNIHLQLWGAVTCFPGRAWDHMAGVLEEEKGRVGACYSGLPHSIGSKHDGWISQSQMGSRRSLKAAPPFPLLFDFKRRTLGLVKAAGWREVRKWKPCWWNAATCSTSLALFSNRCFWVKFHSRQAILTICCFYVASARGKLAWLIMAEQCRLSMAAHCAQIFALFCPPSPPSPLTPGQLARRWQRRWQGSQYLL